MRNEWVGIGPVGAGVLDRPLAAGSGVPPLCKGRWQKSLIFDGGIVNIPLRGTLHPPPYSGPFPLQEGAFALSTSCGQYALDTTRILCYSGVSGNAVNKRFGRKLPGLCVVQVQQLTFATSFFYITDNKRLNDTVVQPLLFYFISRIRSAEHPPPQPNR